MASLFAPGPAATSHGAFCLDPADKLRLDDLYARYAECIADDRIEEWPGFFTEECVYRVTPRVNFDRGLPISIILSESRGGLADRVAAIRHTMVFGPRAVLPMFSGIRATGRREGRIDVRASFVVMGTQNGTTSLVMAGRTFDEVETGADWRFASRVVVYDTDLLPATVIYPV